MGGRKGPDDGITLAAENFKIGDYMDIAITLPMQERRGMRGF